MQNLTKTKIELIKKILSLTAEEKNQVKAKAADIINRRQTSKNKQGGAK